MELSNSCEVNQSSNKSNRKNGKYSVLPMFFTVFLDLLGLGVVIPILPAVLMDPFNGILPLNYSYQLRIILYGLLTAAYPAAQFFGAPMLGTLADNKGRKKILIVSLFGTLIGYIIFTIGIIHGSVTLLFIGRIVDGFTGGNISIAQSAIADISTEETKSKNFGFIGMAFGVGFVIGPYIGGKLSDPSIVRWFSYETPFILATVLSIINIMLVIWRFPETLTFRRNDKINIFSGIKNIRNAFTFKELRVMFLVTFLLNLGHNFFTKFLQVFLMTKFNFSQSTIGDFYGYMGIWIALSQGGLIRILSKRFSPAAILRVSTLLASFAIPLILIPNNPKTLYLVIPFIALLQGMYQPNSAAIVSNLTGENKQGEVLGINQSMQSVAQTMPPIIAAFTSAININVPTLMSAAFTISAWAVFVMFFNDKAPRSNKY